MKHVTNTNRLQKKIYIWKDGCAWLPNVSFHFKTLTTAKLLMIESLAQHH